MEKFTGKRFLNIFNDAETLKINKSKKSIIEIGKKAVI